MFGLKSLMYLLLLFFFFFCKLGLMDLNNSSGGVDVEVMDNLKEPLLKPLDIDNKDKRIRTVKFKIGDIECASCATTVESVLGKLDGIKSATVSPIEGQAAVNYIPELINVSEV